ncbi:MAG: AEC family transporter [Geminicoccaceae bacterium]
MTVVFSALAPVFLMIVIGHGLRRSGVLDEAFWRGVEWLVYWILLPALLFIKAASADPGSLNLLGTALVIIPTILFCGFLALASRWILVIDAAGLTSVMQGAARTNTYVSLAAATLLYGDIGLSIAGFTVAMVVPTANLFNVVTMVLLLGQERVGFKAFLAVARNPFILACFLGLGWNAFGIPLSPIISETLEILGRGALSLGLMAVGASLVPSLVFQAGMPTVVSVTIKQIAMPVIAWTLAMALNLGPINSLIILVCTAGPTSAASFVLARQLGGDAPMMALIITTSTLVSLITMPVAIAIAHG